MLPATPHTNVPAHTRPADRLTRTRAWRPPGGRRPLSAVQCAMPRRVGGVAAAETAVARRPPSDASVHAYPPCRGSSALQSPLGWAVGSASAWELRKHKKRAFGATQAPRIGGSITAGCCEALAIIRGAESDETTDCSRTCSASTALEWYRLARWHYGATAGMGCTPVGADVVAAAHAQGISSMHARTRTRPRIPTASIHACSMQARARSQEAGSPHPSAGT